MVNAFSIISSYNPLRSSYFWIMTKLSIYIVCKWPCETPLEASVCLTWHTVLYLTTSSTSYWVRNSRSWTHSLAWWIQSAHVCVLKIDVNVFLKTRKGDDKSLVRPTSRCRTESIVSLEREFCSCAELQVFSCYRGRKEACQVTRAISTTSRRELSIFFFFLARQGAEGNSRHFDRNIRGKYTIVCHRQKLGGPV